MPKYTPPENACPTGSSMVKGAKGFVCRFDSGKQTDASLALAYKLKPQKISAQLSTPEAFDYWTPSALKKTSVKERRARGCVRYKEEYYSKPKGGGAKILKTRPVSLPYRCPTGFKPDEKTILKDGAETKGRCVNAKGETAQAIRDWSCAPQTSPPCGTKRQTCPVQFVWRSGKPNLRFCNTQMVKKKQKDGTVKRVPNPVRGPGFLVPVNNPAEAVSLSEAACKSWKANGYKWNEREPVIKRLMDKARESYPSTDGLGRARKKRKTRRKKRR